jgi:hypothetical protein
MLGQPQRPPTRGDPRDCEVGIPYKAARSLAILILGSFVPSANVKHRSRDPQIVLQ